MAVPVGPDTSPISFLQKDPLESPQEQKLPVFKRSDSEERISATVHEKTLGLKVYYEKNPIEKWRLRQQLSKKAIFHQSYPGKKFEKWRSGISKDKSEADEEQPPQWTSGSITETTEVDLSNINPASLPSDLSSFQKATIVRLDRSWFTVIPQQLKSLRYLEELSLQRNAIFDVTSEQIKGLHLKKLDLSENPLWYHTAPFAFPSTLEILILVNTRLSEFPRTIVDLRQLRELNVNQNNLSTLPKEIGRLQCLVVLSAEENELSSLPDELWSCKKLRELYLRENQLTTVSQGVGELPDLHILDLRENPLCRNQLESAQLRQALQPKLTDKEHPLDLVLIL